MKMSKFNDILRFVQDRTDEAIAERIGDLEELNDELEQRGMALLQTNALLKSEIADLKAEIKTWRK